MTREQKYKAQLQALGVYREIFDPEIHTLCEMERDHQRTRKAWKAAGSPIESKLYDALTQQRRDILAHRDALFLTPRALRKVRPMVGADDQEEKQPPTILGFVRDKYA